MTRTFFPLLLLGVLSLGHALPAQVTADAVFEPDTVVVGDSSVYRLVLTGEGNSSLNFRSVRPPKMPAVPGLRFRYLGPNHEVRIVNGETSVRLSHLYRVETSEVGVFKVPDFQIEADGKQIAVPSTTLRVVEPGEPDDHGHQGTRETRPAWLEISLPRETLYVGETVPLRVRLVVNSQLVANASLVSEHPEKIGDAFSIGEFGSMTQEQVRRDNVPMSVADWNVLLTPLKTGTQPLVFQLPLAVSLRDRRGRPRDPFESFFGPSPFDRFFSRREEVRAYSKDHEIKILPLPSDSRPNNFSGGIGDFRFRRATPSSSEVRVGEPILFAVEITGMGNFDRLEAPVSESDPDTWRVYDPETSFSPSDSLGYTGTKTFTFTLIPRSGEIESTPRFSFSFFSPEEGEYRTVEIPAQPLKVLPAPPGSSRPPEPREDKNPIEARRGPDLLPLADQWGSTGTLRPPYTGTGFLAVQGLLAALLLTGAILARHRARLRDDPDFARRHRARRAVRCGLSQASRKASSGDAAGFHRAACATLRAAVGPWTPGEPDSLTGNEVLASLPEVLRTSVESEVRSFFRESEGIEYGNRSGADRDLSGEMETLRRTVRTITGFRPSSPTAGPGPTLAILLAIAALAGLPLPSDATEIDSAPTSATVTFDEARAAYQSGDYEKAAAGFKALLPSHSSPEVFYNLGNARYRLRDYAGAILAYERAFALDPANPDIRANLALTREAASLPPLDTPTLAVVGHRLPWSTWMWTSVAAFWLLLSILVLARPLGWTGLWRNFAISVSSLILAASLLGQVPWFLTRNHGIVLSKETPLRIAPTATSPLESTLGAGTTVNAANTHGEYIRVETPEGDGWILKTSLGLVRSSHDSTFP